MSTHCSLRAGGLAQDFFIPTNLTELTDFLKNNTKPILFLGLGSNLLIRDKGFNGVVIKLNKFKKTSLKNNIVSVESGVTLAKLSKFCYAHSLFDAAFLSTIPGTVGGALAMNAGAFGSEFWNYVESVTTVNNTGVIFKRNKSEYDINYRKVNVHNSNEYFIKAVLKFDQIAQSQNHTQLLKQRNQSQPIGKASCGSVFKNPKNHFAAKLIENAQLKNFCIGGACVSDKHANFIINQGNATATDIENLITHIQKTVKSNCDIALETEVKII